MFAGGEAAARRICDVIPNFSRAGNLSVSLYTNKAS
jgi:hypothetical protein